MEERRFKDTVGIVGARELNRKLWTLRILNHEYWNKHIYSTRKGFKECFREETAHLATLKSKKYRDDSLPKDTAEIETGMAEKSSPGIRPTDGQNLVWFGEIEKEN